MNKKVRKYYKEITKGLEFLSGQTQGQSAGYCGTTKRYLGIETPISREFIRDWYANHQGNISFEDWVELITVLSKSETHEFIGAAGKLLVITDGFRKQFNPDLLDSWLNNVEGWAEVDTFCQSKFTAEEMLEKWGKWKALAVHYTQIVTKVFAPEYSIIRLCVS